MVAAALILTLCGLVVSLAGAAWLLFGISPDDPKYVDDGLLYPGPQASKVLPQFILAQRRPAMLVVIGGAVQVPGGVLALVGTAST